MKRMSVKDHFQTPVDNSGFSDVFVKLDVGDNIIRFLPGDVYEIRMHYNTNPRMVCPRTEEDGKCKLCDTRSMLYKRYNGRDNMPENVQRFYDSLKAVKSYYYPVIKYTDTGTQLGYLRVGNRLDSTIKEYIQSFGFDTFDEFGLKLNLKKTAAGPNGFPTITPIPTQGQNSPIEVSDWHESLPDIDAVFKIPDSAQIDEYITNAMVEMKVEL